MRFRAPLIASVVAALASVTTSALPLAHLNGLSVDTLFMLRKALFPERHKPEQSPTVVIALDEETYRRPPFSGTPKVLWTPQLAKVMRAVLLGGAKVIGFDVIFPTSAEKYIPGFDKQFLLALRHAANDGKVVLSQVQHQAKSISPFPSQGFAVGHAKNVRLTNLVEDGDGIIRRLPLFFQRKVGTATTRENSFTAELALRASTPSRRMGARKTTVSAGTEFHGGQNASFLLNFEAGANDIPTYSLADLSACADQGRNEYFRRHFAEKVVLVGAVLDVEDRKITSKRFITGIEGQKFQPRCVFPVMEELYGDRVSRDLIPGVYIHATGINNLIRGDSLAQFNEPLSLGLRFGASALAGLAVLTVSPAIAAAGIFAGILGWTGLSAFAFQSGWVLPFLATILSVLITYVVLTGYRFVIVDKDKRKLRRSFALYLPAHEVDRLAKASSPPKLGGEVRELSIFFSDIENFTSLSEGLEPQSLVSAVNEYLSVITDAIEDHGGFVDKYIGDGVVAVFGAPIHDSHHAQNAVQAAISCQESLRRKKFGSNQGVFGTRIGINTGEVLIGNIGSSRRFNYTVMGDTVNLAARLESANKTYGTQILISDRTAELCRDSVQLRELDTVRVVGREAPIRIFEPITKNGKDEFLPPEWHDVFARGLALYRSGQFSDALMCFSEIDSADTVARLFVSRIEKILASPPPHRWDGVTDLDSK